MGLALGSRFWRRAHAQPAVRVSTDTVRCNPSSNDVWRDVVRARVTVRCRRRPTPDGLLLRGVDNLVVSPSGDLYVAEDGDDMELCLITPDRVVSPFFRVLGHDGSEITGPAFNPQGDRLHFSSQRGGVSGDSRHVRGDGALPARLN